MKALVKFSVEDGAAEIRDVAECQVAAPDEVKVQVKRAAICGTDIKVLHGRDRLFRPPVIMGHEFSGVVAEIGKNVAGLQVGDEVVVDPTVAICGKCRHCHAGNYNICSGRLIAGFSAPGCFTEYAVRKERYVYKLPAGVDLDAGALGEPMAVSVHAVLERARILPGDIVLVAGPGTAGLLVTQMAAVAGGRVLIFGISADAERLKVGLSLGAEAVFCIDTEAKLLEEKLQEISQGNGADVVFECSGVESAANLCLDMVAKQGQYVQVGIFAGKNVSIYLDKACYGEINITGTFAHKQSAWKRALSLLGAGKISVKPIIGPTLPLTDWKKGFEMMEKRQAIKVLFEPKF